MTHPIWRDAQDQPGWRLKNIQTGERGPVRLIARVWTLDDHGDPTELENGTASQKIDYILLSPATVRRAASEPTLPPRPRAVR